MIVEHYILPKIREIFACFFCKIVKNCETGTIQDPDNIGWHHSIWHSICCCFMKPLGDPSHFIKLPVNLSILLLLLMKTSAMTSTCSRWTIVWWSLYLLRKRGGWDHRLFIVNKWSEKYLINWYFYTIKQSSNLW